MSGTERRLRLGRRRKRLNRTRVLNAQAWRQARAIDLLVFRNREMIEDDALQAHLIRAIGWLESLRHYE